MKPPTYLQLGRRKAFGRPVRKPVGPVPPPPDPQTVADFDLGTWRVRPALARMTRADRIVALDPPTLQVLLILTEQTGAAVNRDELAARVFGPGGVDEHEVLLRHRLGFLRRAFSEDGAVRLENAPGDCYRLQIGAPVPGRGLRPADSSLLLENPGAVQAWLARSKRGVLALGLAALIVTALAVSFVRVFERGNTVIRGRVTGVTTLAAERGEKMNPSFSPDGRQLVYGWRWPDGGPEKLWVRPAAGGNPRVLTIGEGADAFPAWSPSGALIAFQRLAGIDCAVFVIAPDGSGQRQVGDCGFGASGPMTWTRDSAALIFAHRAAAVLPTQLVSLNIVDGHLTGVTNPVSGMPGDSRPALASTGRRLLFMRTRAPGVADLALLEMGAGELQKATHDGVPLAGAAWEPGGWLMIFASPRAGRNAIWRARLDGSPPQLLYGTDRDLREPAVSNDGRQLAFEAASTTSRLVRVPLAIAAAASEWRAGGALERSARVAPDHRVVFVSGRGGHDQLWIGGADGAGAQPLTRTDPDYIESPRFSPDGRYVAFGGARAGRFDVWVVEVASGRLERLTDDGASRAPSFSRDGRWLYFASSRAGLWQIWRRGWPDATPAQQLTTEGGLAALESRDGDTLFYVRPDRTGLWRRGREPGGDETLVTPELAVADWRNWDVGSDTVWFVARPAGGGAELARYSINDDRVTHSRALPKLLPESGLALVADETALIVSEVTTNTTDLLLATLE